MEGSQVSKYYPFFYIRAVSRYKLTLPASRLLVKLLIIKKTTACHITEKHSWQLFSERNMAMGDKKKNLLNFFFKTLSPKY